MSSLYERVCGVDVSKASLDLEYRRLANGQIRRVSLSNDRAGHQQVRKLCRQEQISLVVLEATGGLERALHLELHGGDVPVALTDPARARYFARAKKKLAKSDKIDAGVLREMGPAMELKATAPLAENEHALQRLHVRRCQLLEIKQMEENRLGQEVQKQCCKSLKATIAFLQKQLREVEAQIQKLIAADALKAEMLQIIDAIPGFARTSAAMLICMLPELGQLNRRQIAALAGLACYDEDSGTLKGVRRIRGGRVLARNALFMPALTAISKFEPTRKMYERLRVRPGHTPKQAVTACMRKLLVIINARVKELLARRAAETAAAAAA